MVFIKYFLPPTAVSYWAYSLISISVSVVSGYIVSVLTGNKVSAPKYTTIHDITEIKGIQVGKFVTNRKEKII